MAGNTASITFRLFGVDVNASHAISRVGTAAAGTAKSFEASGLLAAKYSAILGGVGTAAVGAGGLLGAGLGVAIVGVGVKFGAMSQQVQATYKTLGANLKAQTTALAAPVSKSLLDLAGTFASTFASLKPAIGGLFTQIAPLVTTLGGGLAGAFSAVVGQLGPLLNLVTPLVKTLSAELAPTLNAVFAALSNILAPITGNSKAFAQFFGIIQQLLPILGDIIGDIVQFGTQVMPVFGAALISVAQALDGGLVKLLPIVAQAVNQLLPVIGVLFSAIVQGVVAVAPILPVFAHAFAQIFSAIAPLIPQIINFLVPAVSALLPIFGSLAHALTPLIPPILAILGAFWPLIPVLGNLAAQIIRAVLPALIPFVRLVASLAGQLVAGLGVALQQSMPALVQLAGSFGKILISLMPLLPPLVQLALAFVPLIPLVTKVAAVLAQVLAVAIKNLVPVVLTVQRTFWIGFKAMADSVLSAVIGILDAASHLPFIGGHFKKAEQSVKDFKTGFDTSMQGAINSAQKGIDGINGNLNRLNSHKVVTIDVDGKTYSLNRESIRSGAQAFAGGGVVGGVGNRDSELILATPGEVVVPTKHVGALASTFAALGIPGFAAGGVVGNPLTAAVHLIDRTHGLQPGMDNVVAAGTRSIVATAAAAINKFFNDIGGGARAFADSKIGLPYVWGGGHGVGSPHHPYGGPFDCSGFVAQVLFAAGIANPNGIVTSFAQWMAPGRSGRIDIGVLDPYGSPSQQHMGIGIGGQWYETGGRAGGTGRTADYFPIVGHVPGLASGLAYVPHDNFPAMLHRGERVLTAAQNAGGGTTIVVNITGVAAGHDQLIAGVRQGIREALRREGRTVTV